MNASLTRKLLATTALLAVAGSANAATIVSDTNTGMTFTDATSGTLTVQGPSGLISVTTNPAVVISSTTASDNVISVASTTAVIKSNAATATISSSVTAGATINNSGTITNVGTGGAIDASTATSAITIRNQGTISGTVTTGSGADVITITNGTQNGNLVLGGGGDTVTVSGTSAVVTGNITNTGSTGTDALTVNNGTVNGTVNLADGTNGITLLNAGRINGNITGGSGADTLTISGTGVVSGTIDGSTGANVLTIDRSAAMTTMGTIANMQTMNVKSDVTAAYAISGVDTALTVDAGKTLEAAANISGLGDATVNGTLQIDAGKTVSLANANFASTGVFKSVVSGTTAGEMILTGALNSSNPISVTIAMGSGSGYVSNGTVIRIVDGGSGTPSATLTSLGSGLYSYNLTSDSTSHDLSVTINRAATASAVTSEAGDGVAAALDAVGGQTVGTTGDFRTIQNEITAATTTGRVNQIVESLTPVADTGAAMASVGVGTAAGSNVSTRLASLRSGGLATGDAVDNHFWIQGFGNHTSQDNKDGNPGYDSNSYGATVGLDTDTLVDAATVGAALTYGRSSVDSNSSNNGTADVDSYMATLYGSKAFDQGMFVNGQVNVGTSSFDFERQAIGFSSKTKGSTDAMQYGAKLEAGKDFVCNNMTLTPLAGLQYSYLDMDKYTETGPAALTVKGKGFSALDASVGGQAAWNFATGDGGAFRPSVRAKLIQRMGDSQFQTTSTFVQGGPAFTTKGVKADKTSVDLGGSLMLATMGGTEFTVDADADLRNSLTGYTGQLKMRMPF